MSWLKAGPGDPRRIVGEGFHLAVVLDALRRIDVLEHDDLRLLAEMAEVIEEALL